MQNYYFFSTVWPLVVLNSFMLLAAINSQNKTQYVSMFILAASEPVLHEFMVIFSFSFRILFMVFKDEMSHDMFMLASV